MTDNQVLDMVRVGKGIYAISHEYIEDAARLTRHMILVFIGFMVIGYSTVLAVSYYTVLTYFEVLGVFVVIFTMIGYGCAGSLLFILVVSFLWNAKSIKGTLASFPMLWTQFWKDVG
ncbi:hypothetical protein ACFL96_19505 [Thermoproteota archaeon]